MPADNGYSGIYVRHARAAVDQDHGPDPRIRLSLRKVPGLHSCWLSQGGAPFPYFAPGPSMDP